MRKLALLVVVLIGCAETPVVERTERTEDPAYLQVKFIEASESVREWREIVADSKGIVPDAEWELNRESLREAEGELRKWRIAIQEL